MGTQREDGLVKMETGTEGILPQAKVAGHHQKLEETWRILS